MNTTNDRADDRQEIENLLPWHAAGTLSRRDAERVERALADDRELARRFELVREELGETIHLNESLGAPSARAMEKLFAAIDAEPARKASFSFDLGQRISEFFSSFSARTLAYAGTAAAVVMLLQAGVIGTIVMKSGQNYGVASHGEPASTAGAYALISFAPQASADDITKFLNTYKATIVEGPKAGMYRVRIAVTGLPKEELARIVKAMQDNKNVVGSVLPEAK